MNPFFEILLQFILLPDHEGLYSNDPHDPGGETMRGITKRVAEKWGYHGPMRDLPMDLTRTIYLNDYFKATSCDKMPEPVAALIFDGSVNQGPGAAGCVLQCAINDMGGFALAVDGGIGPKTLAAVLSVWANTLDRGEFLDRIAQERAELYVQCPTVLRFGAGWFHRLFRCHRLALERLFRSMTGGVS